MFEHSANPDRQPTKPKLKLDQFSAGAPEPTGSGNSHAVGNDLHGLGTDDDLVVISRSSSHSPPPRNDLVKDKRRSDQLVEDMLNGDSHALWVFTLRYKNSLKHAYQSVFNEAGYYLDPDELGDFLSELACKVLKRMGTKSFFRPELSNSSIEVSFQAWLIVIARNQARAYIRYLRRRDRKCMECDTQGQSRRMASSLSANSTQDVVDRLEVEADIRDFTDHQSAARHHRLIEDLREDLSELPELDRQLIELRQNHSLKEISHLLSSKYSGLNSPQGVKYHLKKAYERLRDRWGKNDGLD